MVKRSLSCAGLRAANSIIWTGIVLMGGRSLWAGESTSPSTAVTHKVYTLKSISAEAAKEYLSRLGLGTVSHLPRTNGLLITGNPSDLSKAQAVLKLVDVDQVYEIRLAGPESLLTNLPARDRIAAAIGDIAVGSLDSLPTAEGKALVVIDRHRGQALVIAPKEKIDRIVRLMEGKVILPGLGQDVLGAELDKSAKTSVVEVASWTKSHVLGAAQTEPNTTTPASGTKAQPVDAAALRRQDHGPDALGRIRFEPIQREGPIERGYDCFRQIPIPGSGRRKRCRGRQSSLSNAVCPQRRTDTETRPAGEILRREPPGARRFRPESELHVRSRQGPGRRDPQAAR